eukprot:3157180-Pyramimonas_sp.AAC.1
MVRWPLESAFLHCAGELARDPWEAEPRVFLPPMAWSDNMIALGASADQSILQLVHVENALHIEGLKIKPSSRE